MEYVITQNDINLLYQKEKKAFVKIDLLDINDKIINSLEGDLTTDSFSNDSESSVRRTYNCTFYCRDASWNIGADTNIWIDKKIVPYIGYVGTRSSEITWYKRGTFVMDAPSYQYDATTHSVSLTCLDLMCTLDGTRGGVYGSVEGETDILIEAGSDLRGAIIALLVRAGVKKYNVCSFNKEVPYDIEGSIGDTYYSLLEELIGLYAGYEFFFDIDGMFIVQLKPQLLTEPVTLSSEIINPLVAADGGERRTFDWANVRNYYEVFGQIIEPDYFATNVTGTSSAWVATDVTDVTTYANGDTFAVTIPATNAATCTLNINGLGAKVIYDDDGNKLAANKLTANERYCFRYKGTGSGCFIYLGQYQAYGFYEEKSEDCPYSTTNLGYRINDVYKDENIYSNSLCEQRAKYEVYLRTFMADTISLSLINIPFLSVNQKISYIPQGETEEIQYITKSIQSDSVNGIMTLELARFSEAYPNMAEVYQSMYVGE